MAGAMRPSQSSLGLSQRIAAGLSKTVGIRKDLIGGASRSPTQMAFPKQDFS
jgi:hypothetical protein